MHNYRGDDVHCVCDYILTTRICVFHCLLDPAWQFGQSRMAEHPNSLPPKADGSPSISIFFGSPSIQYPVITSENLSNYTPQLLTWWPRRSSLKVKLQFLQQVRKRWEEIGVWKSWGEQSKKEGEERQTAEGQVTSPPGAATAAGGGGGEMNTDRTSGGFLDIKVREGGALEV